jgi:hypothetical protein
VTGCKLILLRKAEIRLRSIFELTFTVNRLPFRVRARATGMRGPACVGIEFVGLSLTTTRYLHDLIDELAAHRSLPGSRTRLSA